MQDTKHFERLSDSFTEQADKWSDEANKLPEEEVNTKIEYLAKAVAFRSASVQLLKTCIKVAAKTT